MLRFVCSLIVVILLTGLEADCHKRQVRVPAPLPQPSGTATEPQQPAAPSAAPAPVAPEPSTPAPAVPAPQPPTTQPPTLAPPEEPYQKNKSTQSQPPQPTTPAQPPRRATRPPEPNTAPPPRLGDVLTPAQEREYNSSIDQSLTRAQASLSALGNHRLTKEQQSVVGQIQSFIQQAQTSRKTNLPAAKSLAERAEVLARDLVGSLR